jgi:signal peptidase I
MLVQVHPSHLTALRMRFGRCIPLFVIGLAIVAHIATYYLRTLATPTINMYGLRPLFWLIPAAFVFWATRGSWCWIVDRGVIIAAVANSIALAFIQYSAGVFIGLGWSPYSHAPLSIVLNLWYVASILIAREVIRAYLLRSLAPVGEGIAISITWILFTITAIPIASLNALQQPASAFELIGRLLLPTLAIQFLATYLSMRGGPIASIVYLGVMAGIEWYAPILPNLPWMAAAFIGGLVPLIGAAAIQSREYRFTADDTPEDRELIGPSPRVLVTAAFVVAMLWFNTGITGFRPTIVHGRSMQPTYATGDLVVTQAIDPEDLAEGDIVVFRNDSVSVVHRIIAIDETNKGFQFTTQGDNNNTSDQPFLEEDLIGKVQLHIPKIAMPAVWYKHVMTWVLE